MNICPVISIVLFVLLVAQSWLYRKMKAELRVAMAHFAVIKRWHADDVGRGM